VLNCRSTTDIDKEERKLLQCLRKSVMSPHQKQVVCLPSAPAAGRGSSSSSYQIETRSFTSPHHKGRTSKPKPSPRRESMSKTWSSPRRCTPRKFVTAKTRMSTPLGKTGHLRVGDRKKSVVSSRHTPNKRRSQTPRKSTKRTPAKSTLTVELSN